MPKKRSLATLLLLSVLLLIVSCMVSTHLFLNADKQFESMTNDLFCQEVSGNAITLHYTLREPSSYGINDPDMTLGAYPTSSQEANAATENCLAILEAIPRQELDNENQITYLVLQNSLRQSLQGSSYLLYNEPLCPLTGIQAQLPVLLSEYQFYTQRDVDSYLALLTAVPEHFDSLIAFEQAKSDAGLFMASYTADAIIKECRTFLNMGSGNYLYSSFENRLLELNNCSNETRQSYIERNRHALTTFVFPAYQKLISTLTKLRETGTNPNGLCYLPGGTAYYAYLVKEETGSDRTVKELKALTKSQIREDLLVMQDILTSPEYTSLTETSDFTLQDSNPASILVDLKGNLAGNFPPIPDVDTQVKYVQPEMEEYLSPAFYMVPAIDNDGSQTIYINASRLPDDLTLYTTLAHEGYPGHLYQNVYYTSTNPAPIRSLLGCGGYTEGWATYTEMISYYFTGLPDAQATLLQRNASVLLGLYALADIGIHYEGWTLIDAVSFFHEYGITDTNVIEEIYNLIVADPANYLKYYIGYVEFLELKKDAAKQWGDDFTQKRFHQAVLEAGPMPFYLLRTVVLKNSD